MSFNFTGFYCFLVGEPLPSLVAEEKIIFALNAKAVSHLTLLKIRKVYSRVDNKSIAKQVQMSLCFSFLSTIPF